MNFLKGLFRGAGGTDKIQEAVSKLVEFISLLAFIFAFVKICQAAYLFSEGRTSEGKNAIIGAFIAGGASIITGYLFKLWGVDPLSGI